MRYGAFLKQGGVIGFPAPSFGCNIQPYKGAFEHALTVFQEKGYQTLPGPNAFLGEGIGISNTPVKCGQELTDMYLSEKTDALISCGGGELMCEILDHVDFDAIRKAPPKWYMGYSDNTNMTFLLATLCDTASIYGPCAPAFGMEPWDPAVADAFALLCGTKTEFEGYDRYELESLKDEEHPLVPYNRTEPSHIRLFCGEKEEKTAAREVSGRLIGGCMDCLVNLTGTSFDRVGAFAQRYKEDGLLWFLESCDLSVFAMRRAIWEMDHAGWFKHAKGFLIGRPLHMGETMMGLDQYHAVTDLLGKYQVPILMDLDIGHLPPMLPLVTGSMARVTCDMAAGNYKIAQKMC